MYFYSYGKKFQFFVDSETYLNNYPGYYFDLMNIFFPYSIMAMGFIAFIFVYSLLSSFELIKFIIFANPYTLLLIFNYTKEQLIFIGVVMALVIIRIIRSPRVGKIIFLIGFSFLLMRPFYMGVIFVVKTFKIIKLKTFVFIFFILAFAFMCIISNESLLNIYYTRTNIDHVGRDFFPYLCSLERYVIFDFIMCALPAIYGLPLHSDTFSISYLLVLLFILPFYMMIFSRIVDLKSRIGIIIVFFIFNIVIFWWGPTYGAYLRYALPVTWILYLSFFSDASSSGSYKNLRVSKIN